MGTLYIVATPIGNLEDITLRALRILKEADAILCEDTRVTSKLLAHYTIRKPLVSYHQHSRIQRVEQILARLAGGEKLAMVSDAGTPGISDPGNALVASVRDRLPEVSIIPIPGASALGALASVAGISMDAFLFLGFPPHKKGRQAFFQRIILSDVPVVFYESKYRVLKALEALQSAARADEKHIRVVCGRELTKQFETILHGTIDEVTSTLEATSTKGEFTIIIYHASQ